ncbi:hypothetical protein JYT92_00285 [bacterium AH-315-L15]|nr:hypothetical protein [bacterium AH-315-L15]
MAEITDNDKWIINTMKRDDPMLTGKLNTEIVSVYPLNPFYPDESFAKWVVASEIFFGVFVLHLRGKNLGCVSLPTVSHKYIRLK